MQKTYVLDANVLLQAPYALESFEDNNIVLLWRCWRSWTL